MMLSEKLGVLISKLKDKTSSGKAIWTKTSGDNEFKLKFEKGAVTTDHWEDPNGEYVDLCVINSNGHVIERIQFDKHIEFNDFSMLVEVHEMAKNSYFKTDETFDNLFSELDSDKEVGEDLSF